MLRTYKPLRDHPVFVYHKYIQHLVCEVWCNANNGSSCSDLIDRDFEKLYNSRGWVKKGVEEVYDFCKTLTDSQRADIREAFFVNNKIEELCEAKITPIDLNQLAPVVKNKMKPFLIRCYDDLISAKEKLDYYNSLIENQDINYNFCPCCGLSQIESSDSRYREDFDHHGPKSQYPFASVNFANLVPLCNKCNAKHKSRKNPFKNKRKSFYAFKPLDSEFVVTISINSTASTNYGKLQKEEVSLLFNNDPEKVDSWNWLFDIKDLYNEKVREFAKNELRIVARSLRLNIARGRNETYQQILTDIVDNYYMDQYDGCKFLRAAFLREMLQKPEWTAVYHQYL